MEEERKWDLDLEKPEVCAQCKENVLGPKVLCLKGHVICSNCSENLEVCPELDCGDALPYKKVSKAEEENKALTEIMDSDKLACPSGNGTCETFVASNKSEEHQYQFQCEDATLNYCSLMGLDCSKEVRIPDLSEHFHVDHKGTSLTDYVLGEELVVTDDTFRNLKEGEDEAVNNVVLIHTKDQIFVLESIHNVKEKTISWSIFCLETDKIASKFLAFINLIQVSETPVEGCVSRKWQGWVAGIKLNGVSPVETKNSFSVPYDRCPSLVVADEGTGKLKWKIVLKICHGLEDEENKALPSASLESNSEQEEFEDTQESLELEPEISLGFWNMKVLPVAAVVALFVAYSLPWLMQQDSK